LEQQSDVVRYADMFARLCAESLDPAASSALIGRVARELG
jgi:hypothetical protein